MKSSWAEAPKSKPACQGKSAAELGRFGACLTRRSFIAKAQANRDVNSSLVNALSFFAVLADSPLLSLSRSPLCSASARLATVQHDHRRITMPYLRLPGSVSLYYSIISSDDASDASSKPWLVVLCPVLADECSRIPQVQEPRLRAAYNILCIDLRSQGRSRPTIKPSYDTFVAAADVAFVMEALQIPPAYIFAPGFVSFPVGVKLALLFPSQVRGLAFAGTPHMWGTPAGLSSFM